MDHESSLLASVANGSPFKVDHNLSQDEVLSVFKKMRKKMSKFPETGPLLPKAGSFYVYYLGTK